MIIGIDSGVDVASSRVHEKSDRTDNSLSLGGTGFESMLLTGRIP